MPEQEIVHYDADFLIIGGGTAGCLAGVVLKQINPDFNVIVLEKAHIERSGCLAGGMNAINAYIPPEESVEGFVRHIRADAMGLIREDLVLSMAGEINKSIAMVESWGLPIQKDAQGNYLRRGRWNIKINGESLKPLLAQQVVRSGITVLNRVLATNYIVHDDRVCGAYGLGVRDGKFYLIRARATLCATGGAAGIYKPNNPSAHHKMWYCPFNTGAGYAMGIRAGAEMTSFEMRFIALRTKDAIAPTGTLALGFRAPQVNALGERFMLTRFIHLGGESAPTPYRIYGVVLEEKEGRGPCFLDTRHLSEEQLRELKSAYLDMYPTQVLYWASNKIDPSKEPVQLCGTEPYVVGGHCQAGYHIGVNRRTTLEGLFAAGDVAGGAPLKFVSGCWAEAVIAARSMAELASKTELERLSEKELLAEMNRVYAPLERFSTVGDGVEPKELELRMQKEMDEYAGGVSRYYEMNEEQLQIARRNIARLKEQTQFLIARKPHELMLCHEVIDRLDVCEVLIRHLIHRRETRWPVFQTRIDYPERDDRHWLKFVNSIRDPSTGEIIMLEYPYQQLIPGDRYLP